jgi:hypothetical protein
LTLSHGGGQTIGQQIDEVLTNIHGPDTPTKISLDLYPKEESPLVE